MVVRRKERKEPVLKTFVHGAVGTIPMELLATCALAVQGAVHSSNVTTEVILHCLPPTDSLTSTSVAIACRGSPLS